MIIFGQQYDRLSFEQMCIGIPLKLDHLRIFSCFLYVYIAKNKRKKLDPKSIRCMFTRYDESSKLYYCFNFAMKIIIITKDVMFVEWKRGPISLQQAIEKRNIDAYFFEATRFNKHVTATRRLVSSTNDDSS
jgi:hypothetical protein